MLDHLATVLGGHHLLTTTKTTLPMKEMEDLKGPGTKHPSGFTPPRLAVYNSPYSNNITNQDSHFPPNGHSQPTEQKTYCSDIRLHSRQFKPELNSLRNHQQHVDKLDIFWAGLSFFYLPVLRHQGSRIKTTLLESDQCR